MAIGSIIDGVEATHRQMSVSEAEEALLVALRTDCFRASGLRGTGGFPGSAPRMEIPPLEWVELKPYEGRHKSLEVRFAPLGDGYSSVLIPSAAVRGLWREPVERQLRLPQLMPPSGDGYMPLYCAAQWIATRGGSFDFDPEDHAIWVAAYSDLLAALSSGKVGIIGSRAGAHEPLPPHLFAACQVDYPFSSAPLELIMGEDFYLRSYPYIDEEHWRRGFDDAWMNRRHDRWKQLMVERSNVLERWPFGLEEPTQVSGLPGRPSSKHLVVTELERRAAAGELNPSIVAESRYLSKWLSEQPGKPPPAKAKSIETAIRTRYYELRGRK